MDIATIVGFILAYVIIGGAIALGGPFILFVNVPSLLVVIGGTFAVTLMRVTLGNFLGSFKIGLKGFFYKLDAPQNLIDESVELANIARKEGILALEGREIGNAFLERGIGLCIDGHAPEVVKNLLSKDINMSIERHTVGADMFKGDVSLCACDGHDRYLDRPGANALKYVRPGRHRPGHGCRTFDNLIRRDYRQRFCIAAGRKTDPD